MRSFTFSLLALTLMALPSLCAPIPGCDVRNCDQIMSAINKLKGEIKDDPEGVTDSWGGDDKGGKHTDDDNDDKQSKKKTKETTSKVPDPETQQEPDYTTQQEPDNTTVTTQQEPDYTTQQEPDYTTQQQPGYTTQQEGDHTTQQEGDYTTQQEGDGADTGYTTTSPSPGLPDPCQQTKAGQNGVYHSTGHHSTDNWEEARRKAGCPV